MDKRLNLLPNRLSHARVLVQRQWKNPSAVEIYFENIWSFSLDTVQFIFSSEASEDVIEASECPSVPVLRLAIEDSDIVFERMWWRDRSDWLGPTHRFGPFEIPVDDYENFEDADDSQDRDGGGPRTISFDVDGPR